MIRIAAIATSAALLAACSSSTAGGPGTSSDASIPDEATDGGETGDDSASQSAGSADVTGSFNGQALGVQSAFAGIASAPGIDAGSILYEAVINLVSVANACSFYTLYPDQSVYIHDSQDLTLLVITDSPLTPGTFPIVPPNIVASTNISALGAVALYSSSDAVCNGTDFEEAASGTITITTVTASEFTGTFDLVLGEPLATGTVDTINPDHVSGSFTAFVCPDFSTDLTDEVDGSTPSQGAGMCL
ncbi:MAG: hypothetical protein ABSF69_16720 [Polyangiaceae bacterium]|jgi:hypothetical protein